MTNILVYFGIFLIFSGIILVGVFWQKTESPNPNNIKMLMMGRSTMSLWFKHWNWPQLLNWKTTYRPWPLPWREKVSDGVNLFYKPLNDPGAGRGRFPWGDKMYESFRTAVDTDMPDAVFFKFCFVDFQVTKKNQSQRFLEMKTLIGRVVADCEEGGVLLVLGNALPLGRPNPEAILLQRDYNLWLEELADQHPRVRIFDLYGPLVGADGSLKQDYWKSKSDDHPNDQAFRNLDDSFFGEMLAWVKES